MSPTRSGYKELGLEMVEPLQDQPRKFQRPPMANEKKYEGAGDPIKILLEEALERQRNVQVNFEIAIFEGQIDTNVIDKWLNLLDGYFFVHEFSSQEKIIFALLKVAPHVKDWWETYCEQKNESTVSLFSVATTCDSFRNTVKEQYYPVKSYEEKYIKWTALRQGRDQDVTKFTNIFHTLHTHLGIKDSKLHLVLKYRNYLHRYIRKELEFLNISSLCTTYRYTVKIEQKFNQKKRDFGSANPKTKGQSQGGVTQDNPSKPQENNNTTKLKKDTEKWHEFHKSPTHNTKPNKENGKGKQIIDAEPNVIVATAKIHKNEPEDPEEGEHLFHSQMWVKASLLEFIINSGSQKNLILAEVIKKLGLLTTPHLQSYSIGWLHEGRDLKVRP
eukprot:PITA_35736